MCAHAENQYGCPLCEEPPVFTREQVAFLEDLLINRGCMPALHNGKNSSEPDKCRACAHTIFDMVEVIRQMSE